MGNTCESPINVVKRNKPKMLTGLDQKVCGQVQAMPAHLTRTFAPPAERRTLTHFGTNAERGKPVVLSSKLSARKGAPQGKPTGLRVWEDGESEGRSVVERIEVEPPGDITSRESGQTSIWSSYHERT
jgi:hypothetical protein